MSRNSMRSNLKSLARIESWNMLSSRRKLYKSTFLLYFHRQFKWKDDIFKANLLYSKSTYYLSSNKLSIMCQKCETNLFSVYKYQNPFQLSAIFLPRNVIVRNHNVLLLPNTQNSPKLHWETDRETQVWLTSLRCLGDISFGGIWLGGIYF